MTEILWPKTCPVCDSRQILSDMYECDCTGNQKWAVMERIGTLERRQADFRESLPSLYRSYLNDPIMEDKVPSVEKFLGGHRFVFLEGEPGRGKTHLAVRIAKWLQMTQHLTALFMSDLTFFKMISDEIGKKEEPANLLAPDVLIYDDLGKQKTSGESEFFYRSIFRIIESRYSNNKITIITSQYSPTQVSERLSQDRAARDALTSRLASGKSVVFSGTVDHRLPRLL